MQSTVLWVHEYRPAALLRVTGDDSFDFLQGQFSNELRKIKGSATYGLWLNQKGKVVADSHVLRLGDKEFLLASVESTVASIKSRLESYIVADDVILSDETAECFGLALIGPRSGEAVAEILSRRLEHDEFASGGGAVVFRGRRATTENFEIIGPPGILAEWKKNLDAVGAVPTDAAEVERVRIAAGRPAIPRDLGPADLPQEGGLEDAAISFTKGCFLGQEVMSRLKNVGQIRRRLHVVRGSGAPPAAATPLFQGLQRVGEIRSAVAEGRNFLAHAMVSLVTLDARAGLSLTAGGEPVLTLDRHG